MVLTDALCYINLASAAMMNGVCCFYQMQEEKERHQKHEDAIRRAIREEWDRNRMYDMEQRKQQEYSSGGGMYYVPASSPSTVEHRRNQLMRSKFDANNMSNGSQTSSRGSFGQRQDDPYHEKAPSLYSEPIPTYESMAQQIPMKRRHSSFVPNKQRSFQSVKGMSQQRHLSSLLDDGDDEDDGNGTNNADSVGVDGIESLEEVALE